MGGDQGLRETEGEHKERESQTRGSTGAHKRKKIKFQNVEKNRERKDRQGKTKGDILLQ